MEWRPEYHIFVDKDESGISAKQVNPSINTGIYNHFETSVVNNSIKVVPRFLFGLPSHIIEGMYGKDVSSYPIIGVFSEKPSFDRVIIQVDVIPWALVTCFSLTLLLRHHYRPIWTWWSWAWSSCSMPTTRRTPFLPRPRLHRFFFCTVSPTYNGTHMVVIINLYRTRCKLISLVAFKISFDNPAMQNEKKEHSSKFNTFNIRTCHPGFIFFISIKSLEKRDTNL